ASARRRQRNRISLAARRRWTRRDRRGIGGCGRRGRRAGLLERVEIDEREIVREDRRQLARLRLREVALRLNDEEAGGHAGVEAFPLGVEPLVGQLAGRARRVDPPGVHLDFPPRVADLLDGARLGALETLLGLP